MFDGVDLKEKRVFVRADLNVPLENGKILDDSRLAALLPTIDALLSRGATLIVGTHIDRPQGSDPALSTEHLLPWFKNKGYQIEFLSDPQDLDAIIKQHHPQIILLENLRFFPGEQSKDQQERNKFAHSLAQLADYYVNDAFGLVHRDDTSITDLPALFDSDKRSLGYLVAQERKVLTQLTSSPVHPFLLIIGGNKLSSKLPLVDTLLDKVDMIAWCPAPVFTLLHVQKKPTGKSFIDQSAMKPAQELLKKAAQKKVTFFYPVDYQVAHTTLDGPLSVVEAQDFPPSAVGVSIGPKTVAQYSRLIQQSQLVFYNGLMGMLTRPETLTGVKGIFEAMAAASGTTLVAGGDSVAAARQLGIKGIDHLSTGGGATLAYLSGTPLPGLKVFDD